ncbi:site-specific recombinase XerD [Motilibacter peucedani]|uniref:Site-specific recombinase XerD n=1 Tax=Motilibacter peucedani TaxID=598650 RepID=A0A420XT93_9ACTN|nr:site-specific integrase [Motilibacter peucedani]RKS77959.1 site-specific recombinase XerD [Motilibacter peucedani]
MAKDGTFVGVMPLHLVGREPLKHPAEQMLEAMLDGWRSQQLARGLSFVTIDSRERAVRRFHMHSNEWPWRWNPQLADEWFTDLRVHRHISHSTLRALQSSLRQFCWFITDPAYGWSAECERLFGTHPVQVCLEENTSRHVSDVESRPTKRAFTRDELQAFFDHADAQVDQIRQAGRKGALSAFRDAVIFKTAYAWGLRRNEVRMLDVVDFGLNAKAAEFGRFGVLYVRHGKAMRGSPAKRRGVLTVWDWAAECLEEWVTQVRGHYPTAGSEPALFPSERSGRVALTHLNRVFARYRREVGLDEALDLHSLRRSYVTHLIEDGFDALFVQQQVGHEHASTTSLYTCVSSDYRTSMLRRALDKTLSAANQLGQETR